MSLIQLSIPKLDWELSQRQPTRSVTSAFPSTYCSIFNTDCDRFPTLQFLMHLKIPVLILLLPPLTSYFSEGTCYHQSVFLTQLFRHNSVRYCPAGTGCHSQASSSIITVMGAENPQHISKHC